MVTTIVRVKMRYIILKIIFKLGREKKYKIYLQNGKSDEVKLKSTGRKSVNVSFKKTYEFSKTFVKREFLVIM